MKAANRWRWMSSKPSISNLSRMVDFQIFDSLIDAVFAIDATVKVLYSNESGATLCQSSVRRMVGKAVLSDIVKFDDIIIPLNESAPGWSVATQYLETTFSLLKADKKGRVQVAVHPV